MSKYNLERMLRRELGTLNDIIDAKIIRGLSYAREARRHRFLQSSLYRLRQSDRSGWLARSLGII